MGVNSRSLANLRPPWQPGESGNSKGGAGKRSIQAEIVRALSKRVLVGQPLPLGMDACEALAEAILYHAIQGDSSYTKIAIDRTDGPVSEPEKPPPDIARQIVIPDTDDRPEPDAAS